MDLSLRPTMEDPILVAVHRTPCSYTSSGVSHGHPAGFRTVSSKLYGGIGLIVTVNLFTSFTPMMRENPSSL
ncbi:MAG TPA: hypothetical protein VMT57_03340 [Candidatus Thermoplasmatota archaeon]|nr:hypothetical protein [Candidatus Thermoplasmatota archaeon]